MNYVAKARTFAGVCASLAGCKSGGNTSVEATNCKAIPAKGLSQCGRHRTKTTSGRLITSSAHAARPESVVPDATRKSRFLGGDT